MRTASSLICAAGVNSADDVRRFPKALVQHSPERRKLNLELRKYLYKNLYYNPVVHEPNRRAVKILEQLFKYYLAHPKKIGEGARRRIRQSRLAPRRV